MVESKQAGIKKQVVKEIFTKILDSSNAINAVLLSSIDGHPLVKHVKVELSDSTLAAMASSCIALGDRIAVEVKQNACNFVILQNEDGFVALKRVGKKLVVTVLADSGVNLGLLLSATKDAEKSLLKELAP